MIKIRAAEDGSPYSIWVGLLVSVYNRNSVTKRCWDFFRSKASKSEFSRF